MARKKISTTVYLESAQLAALREVTARTKVPMATLIREGVEAVLAALGQALPLPVSQPYGAAVS
jgi:hypothetical protein